jgi:WD40 repeat protein
MLQRLFPCVLLLIISVFYPAALRAQDCSPPKITANAKNYNIFSPEQEMVLGDLIYQKMAGDTRFVRDPELVAHINAIGEKLIKHLPPTGIKFQFFIVDIPEANAFNVPGGYVFISRKLIGFANNEDELAGVMAHELGHGIVRHGATSFSEMLKKVLNVTQVGDRKDITDKYNSFIEHQRTKTTSRGSGEASDRELEADRVGLFAMIAAGYDPNAFASFFDRLVETNGKTGNWFSDMFGGLNPEEKRLREMVKISDQVPAQCREGHEAGASQEFLKWQADVVSYHYTNQREDLPGLLWKKELTPKLRSDISHLAFSPDGKYFLAQDDSAITVVQRDPAKVAFQIPAADAENASFTPDGHFVVFGTQSLRYEKWSVADAKPAQIRELVVRRDCWEHAFSPDGNYLACVDYGLSVDVLDTRTGKKVFEKKEFYRLTSLELLVWVISNAEDKHFFNIEFSPASQYLAVSRSSQFRFQVRFNAGAVNQSEDTLLALDMNTLQPMKTGSDLRKVTSHSFMFIGKDRIIGMISDRSSESGIFSFPDGKRLAQFEFGADTIERTADPNYVIVRPLKGAKMGIFDLSRQAIVTASDKADVAIWNHSFVFESNSGMVMVADFHYDEAKKALELLPGALLDIPVASIGRLSDAELSGNLQWLAVSTKTRGALWNLSSGERKGFVRGFRGAVIADDGRGIIEFPQLDPLPHTLGLLDPTTQQANPFRDIPERGADQYRGLLLVRHSLKDPVQTEGVKPSSPVAITGSDRSPAGPSLAREVRFELRSVINDKLVWSREFPKEAPRYFFDPYSGRLMLYWTLGSEVGKARLKDDPALGARASALGNVDDDYLMEVVDAFAGRTVGSVLLDTGKHSFTIRSGTSEGDWLVLHDSQNRVLVYSLKDGELRHRFFGSKAAINPTRAQIVVENYPGELTFYDLNTGDSDAHLDFSGPTAFARFTLDGKKLFVLSGEQTAYAFDVDKLTPKVAAKTQ